MSVSLINPSGYPSVQDDLWTIASSTASGQTDFKFVFDVYNGANQLVRCKVYPDPTNGKGYFDAGPIVRNEITYDWFKPVNGNNTFLYDATDKVTQTYNIRVGEDYSGITTLNLASGNVSTYNYAPSLFKRRQTTINSFLNNWLTNRLLTAKCNFNSKFLIPTYITAISNEGLSMYITIDDNQEIISSFANPNGNKFVQCDIGPSALNAAYGSTLITSNTQYYDVQIANFEFTNSTPLYRIFLDCHPTYTPYNLYFINQYGMYDTACFNLVSKLNLDTERKSFTKLNKKFNTGSVGFYDSNNVYYESKINYASKTNWTYKLNMDFMADAEYIWLAELMTSPQIYMEIDSNYYPVTIKNTNYEYIKHNVQGLRVLELDIELNQERYGFQR
jgi:hypothetical protein